MILSLEMENNGQIERRSRFFEGCGKEGPVRSILLCEFHPTAGPKITCQIPNDYISKETFEAVSVYLIPKPQLLRCIVTITLSEIKIVGFPMRIDNKKYARNEFYFNLCFVCDAWARTVQYESVIKKLSEYLTVLEFESNFLSKRDGSTQSNKSGDRLMSILEQVRTDLNSHGMCTLVEGNCATHLKVNKIRPDPPPVYDYQVPVFLETPESFRADQWDLTTQQILPYIDGINHVSKISTQADVDNNLVKTCLQNLMYYFIVSMVPIFQYSNMYTVTPKIQKLAVEKQLQDDCLRTVAKSSWQLPDFRDVFKVYCSMSNGASVRDVCLRHNLAALRIDERKLVQFGLVEGFLRRINKYPVYIAEGAVGEAASLYSHFNGLQSYDEICCSLGISYQQLDDLIEKDPNVIIICK